MGDVIDLKSRSRVVVDLLPARRRVHLDTGLSGPTQAECPYCQKKLELPRGYSASFTCRRGGAEHRHMRDGKLLVER